MTPKQKAWNAFSRYIRTRDCLKSTGDRDRGVCVTCGRVFDFKKLQAGHFIPGRRNSILFNEQCVHAQCYGCNVFGRGKIPEYELFMNTVYGKKTVEELWNKSRTIIQYKAHDYERIENEYKEKLKCLK